MSEETLTLQRLIDNLQNEIGDEFGDIYESSDSDDYLHELVDAAVPVYTGDIIDVFRSDTRLWSWEPEIETAGQGPIGVIQTAIYEALRQEAAEHYAQLCSEEEDRRSDLDDFRGEVVDILNDRGHEDAADTYASLSDLDVGEHMDDADGPEDAADRFMEERGAA